MNIVVCIKQVPGTSQVGIDPETGRIKRDGAPAKMNPYDLYAIETAMLIKEQLGGKVTAVTMGPPQAEAIMKEAYMMGLDEGVVFSDFTFAGADVLATSYTLAAGIRAVCPDFDLIICGKQTTDGDTAQVGPAISEHLHIPCAAWVSSIENITDKDITVGQNFVSLKQIEKLRLPCLITVEKDINTPRLPSYRMKKETKDKPVRIATFSDFIDRDEKHYGQKGSATTVERIFPPKVREGQIFLEGTDSETADQLMDIMISNKFIARGEV